MYDAFHLEPTYRKDQLGEKLDESDPRRFQPIKAAKNEQTSFTTVDELVAYVSNLFICSTKKKYTSFMYLKYIGFEVFRK